MQSSNRRAFRKPSIRSSIEQQHRLSLAPPTPVPTKPNSQFPVTAPKHLTITSSDCKLSSRNVWINRLPSQAAISVTDLRPRDDQEAIPSSTLRSNAKDTLRQGRRRRGSKNFRAHDEPFFFFFRFSSPRRIKLRVTGSRVFVHPVRFLSRRIRWCPFPGDPLSRFISPRDLLGRCLKSTESITATFTAWARRVWRVRLSYVRACAWPSMCAPEGIASARN